MAVEPADCQPADIDLIIPTGLGIPTFDLEELAALQSVFGERAAGTPIWSVTPYVGNSSAAHGAVAAAVACRALAEQTLPATINCDQPLGSFATATAPSKPADLQHVLLFQTSYAGQNAAVILKKV